MSLKKKELVAIGSRRIKYRLYKYLVAGLFFFYKIIRPSLIYITWTWVSSVVSSIQKKINFFFLVCISIVQKTNENMCRRWECSWITCWLGYLVKYQMRPRCRHLSLEFSFIVLFSSSDNNNSVDFFIFIN